jgi:ketosteroid isomerase-like protein
LFVAVKILFLSSLWLLLMAFDGVLFAQSSASDSLILEQVWRPFCRAFATCDTDAFMALHHPAAKRVIRDNDLILNKLEYAQSFGKSCTHLSESRSKRTLELRFIQSVVDGTNAFQEGMYKSHNLDSQGIANSYYGKFQVLLTKEGGRWLIMMDADSSAGVKPEDFNHLEPIK